MNKKSGFDRQWHWTPTQQYWATGLLFVLCATLLFFPLSQALAATPTPAPSTSNGFDYVVQANDTWTSVALRTGVPLAELRAANPQAIRRNGWLLSGERLHIPTDQNVQMQVYVVRPGEGWGIIAERFGITIGLLQAANPRAIRSNYVLYRGERLVIPVPVRTGSTTPTPAAAEAKATPVANTTAVVAATKPVTATAPSTPATNATSAANTAAATATAAAVAKATTEAVAKVTQAAEATSAAKSTSEAAAASAAQATGDAAATTTAKTTAEANETATAQAAIEATTVASATVAAEAAATAQAAATAAVTTTVAPTNTTAASQAVTQTAPAASTAATGTITATGALTTTGAVTSTAAAACPPALAGYPDLLLSAVNSSNGVVALRDFLEKCGAAQENGVVVKDLNGDDAKDIIVIYKDPTSATTTPLTDLLVLDGSIQGFKIGHRARAAGEVHLLATADINEDKQPDIVWSDTTCGASTCFDNVEVYSWVGNEWRPWLKDQLTMAYAQINLDDVSQEGQGQEIIAKGGVYGSVGAGPQRTRTEVWGSVKGEPYTLLTKTYDASSCLYHVVLDANEAFLKGPSDTFASAEALYTKAATEQKLTKCWVRENELPELRSFSLFRLALVAAYQGKPTVATDLINSISTTYAGSIYDKAGQVWKASYLQGNDIGSACAATNEFAKNNSETWQLLADYGYANPSFAASDVCPVLDVEMAKSASSPANQVGVTTTVTSTATTTGATTITKTGTTTATSVTTATKPISTTPSVTATKPPTQTTVSTKTVSTVATTTVATTTAASGQNALAPCPADLAGYTNALTTVLKAASGDEAAIQGWMRSCGALDEKRGALKLVDLNGDGLKDVVFLPTIVSDRGFGPNGTQGAVLVYHAQKDGSYTLVAQPEIYGQPALLSTEDLNGDGKMDLAWTVEGCSTFCVLETQIASWDGKSYTSTIQPGAVIAAGSAKFEPVAAGDPGQGQQLVLNGGMSGTPEGGLAVPHTEVWQSVKGAPYQRIRWHYDRNVEGNDCLGLRLVEADVALQAAPVLGYKPALDLYTQTLDPKLKACSIFGMAADQELVILQGLASFRLIQAQALSGALDTAKTALATLTKGQPDSQYTAAAKQWLDEYTTAKDDGKACAAVQPIFDKNEELWKITDHFGYNHPALAAEQVCYKG